MGGRCTGRLYVGMRFFTREWAIGGLAEGETENTVAAYQVHLLRISHALPGRLREMIERVSLHDGLVQKAVLRRDRVLDLLIRAGDLQRGYVDAALHYRNVSSVKGNQSPAVLLASDDLEILYDEIDVSLETGELEHRFLFHPDGEVMVRFIAFDYDVMADADRFFTRQSPVFEEE